MSLLGWARPEFDRPWAEFYWASVNLPHRDEILDALNDLAPVTSVYEVGCNAGPMLARLKERRPDIRVAGCDMNDRAVSVGREHGLDLIVGDLRAVLPIMADDSVDVVLSCCCLAYTDPAEIAGVLAHIRRVARVGCVIAEPMDLGNRQVAEGYRHDYRALLGCGQLRTLRQPWRDDLNAVLVARW